jgi:hypothetical protein
MSTASLARTIESDDTDAAGERRLSILSAFTTTASTRRALWRDNPYCVACGEKVESPDLANFLHVPDEGAVLACRGGCFAKAVARFNPKFERAAAIAHAKMARDLRLVPDVAEAR